MVNIIVSESFKVSLRSTAFILKVNGDDSHDICRSSCRMDVDIGGESIGNS
jgi:hypothetical protein